MDKKVSLQVNGQGIPLNPFVRKIFINVIEGLIQALDKVPISRQKIEILIEDENS